MQGGSSQCMHRVGRKRTLAWGNLPTSLRKTGAYWIPVGVPFSVWQAIVQASHPTQRARSMTIPSRAISRLSELGDFHPDAGIQRSREGIDPLDRVGKQGIKMDPLPVGERERLALAAEAALGSHDLRVNAFGQ